MYLKERELDHLEELTLQKIGGENKSTFAIRDFLNALENIRRREDGNDFNWHLVDTFSEDNDINENYYNKLCEDFIGKEMEQRIHEYEHEGPYGGRFESWNNFYNWKEG